MMEVRAYCSSDPCEFFRVGHDANGLNLPLLDFNAQNEDSLSANADDQRGLAVDHGHLHMSARWWHKALASSHAKACHHLTPSQRAHGRSFDLPAPIGPQTVLASCARAGVDPHTTG